jgi:type I restriction enzyme S subunit
VRYIFYLLQSRQEEIYKAQTGGAQPHIHPKDIEPIEIKTPQTIKEQTAIATILSDMDTEITALETKRDKYKQIKTGMMQQLLTGQIRLI